MGRAVWFQVEGRAALSTLGDEGDEENGPQRQRERAGGPYRGRRVQEDRERAGGRYREVGSFLIGTKRSQVRRRTANLNACMVLTTPVYYKR